MNDTLCLIGFGEAGSTFAAAGEWTHAQVYDRLPKPGIALCADTAAAVAGARVVLSLVTADQALAVAQTVARTIEPDALYLDMNSVAPDTKRAAAAPIEAAGGHYVDVAVMAPVDPARLAVPLLLSGERAEAARSALAALGFTDIRIVGTDVGRASSIKMIRSVMVKGIEALTAECVLAAETAGVADEVLASLDASEKPRPWATRADYNLDRMMVHGLRRAAEMEEVVKTLDALGTGSAMTRGTVERQRAIGALALAPDAGLPHKIAQIRSRA